MAGVNPLGARTTMAYDAAGQRRRTQDANGRLTTFVYDAAGRNITTINTLGYRTTTLFDAAGQTRALWDANGGRNTFTYDGAGRRTQWIDPLGRRTTSTYDAASNQTVRIDARGYRTTYVYDADQNLTGRKYGDGTRATFVYDSLGLRTRMENETGRYTTTYDELSQMRTVTSPPSFRITYAWDAVGQRAVMTAPTGGRFTYRYDAAGRIERIINPEGDRTSYAYDAGSRRTVKRLANGTRASFTYDAADNLTTLANMFPNGTYISKYDYKYDPTGNRYAVAEADGSRVTWLYDVLYQLTGENRTGTTPFRNTFCYDPLGNRLWKNESGTRNTYAYDAANQLRYGQEATGRTTYTFDAAGNQAKEKTPAGAITTTTWNYENQPTLYRLPDATRVTMAYHPDLLRVQKDASTGTTKFVWDEQNYLAEADGANVVTTVYTNEPQTYGNLVSSGIGGTGYYHHFDGLMSTRQVTGSGAIQLNFSSFDAWGVSLQRSGTASIALSWIGELGYYFELLTNTYYIRNRSMSISIGRWQSRDAQLFLDGPNLFVYVANSPILRFDPSGLACKPTVPGVQYIRRGRFSYASLEPRDPEDDYDFYPRVGSDFSATWSALGSPVPVNSFVDDCCCCSRVAIVQIVKQELKGGPFSGLFTFNWSLDKGFPYPFADTVNPCSVLGPTIRMSDAPNFWRGLNPRVFSQNFETCAVCLDGIEGLKTRIQYSEPPIDNVSGATVYGCLPWWHSFNQSTTANPHVTVGRKEYYEFSRLIVDHAARPSTGQVVVPNVGNSPPSADFKRILLQQGWVVGYQRIPDAHP